MASETAIAEVLLTKVCHLAELPIPTTATLKLCLDDDIETNVRLTTSRASAAQAVVDGCVCLTPLEFEALAVALADGRCTRKDALRAIRAKESEPKSRIDLRRLLGPVHAPDAGVYGVAAEHWTVADLCAALGARVVEVEVHGE